LVVNMSCILLYIVSIYCPCNYLFISGFMNLFLRLWVSTMGTTIGTWARTALILFNLYLGNILVFNVLLVLYRRSDLEMEN
jgi:hypothetical protein